MTDSTGRSPPAQEMRGEHRPFLIHTRALTVDTKSMEKVLRKCALVLFLCCVKGVCFVPIEPRIKFSLVLNRVLSSDKDQL